MANLVQELNNLDFSSYIGGPLQAAIKAQSDASLASIHFIKTVGFKEIVGSGTNPSDYDLVYADFKYKKTVPDDANPGNVKMENYTLSVPILTLVTIPAIRIEEITIDFSAKLNSCDTSNIESELGLDVSAGFGNKSCGANFKASVSYKRKSTTGSEVTRAYDLAVHVRAVNDEMPAGLDRILRILESEIADVPTTKSKTNK